MAIDTIDTISAIDSIEWVDEGFSGIATTDPPRFYFSACAGSDGSRGERVAIPWEMGERYLAKARGFSSWQ